MSWRIVARTADVLAEGPVWDEIDQRLHWVDIERGLLHSVGPDGQDLRTLNFPERIGSFAFLAQQDGYVLALERSIAICDRAGTNLRRLFVNGEITGTTRFNDGKCDPAGRFWAGTLDLAFKRPLGGLYRCDGARTFERVLSGVCVSNGLAWSPDGRRMHFADSPSRRVDRFEFDARDGSLGTRETFFDTSALPGVPDGATVSADAGYWLALYGGAAVLHITADGRLKEKIDVPVARPTCCAFGGPDLRTLYVTCAADEAGVRASAYEDVSVLALDVGHFGLPAARFRGAGRPPSGICTT